jgi:hypothetical protein
MSYLISSSSTKFGRSDSTNISDDNDYEIIQLNVIINNLRVRNQFLINNHKKILFITL